MRSFSFSTVSFFTSIILLLIFANVSSFTMTSSTLTDLQATDSTFQSDANYWIFSSLVSSTNYYVCNSVYILAGYNILGPAGASTAGQSFKRVYTGLPTHAGITLNLNIYLLDAWATADTIQITVVSGTTFTITNYNYGSFTTAQCGSSSYNDYGPVKASATFTHSASTLVLEVASGLSDSSSVKSFGIRDVSISFLSSAPSSSSACTTNPSGSSCQTCSTSSNTQCYLCTTLQFLSSSQTCTGCSTSCDTCFGSGASSCLSCPSGQYLARNNTCVSGCPSPLTSSSDGVNSYCSTSCSSTGQYTYWDKSCSSCSSPLSRSTVSTFLVCSYPCSSNQYLYWNGSCASSCISPLVTQVSRGYNFCNNPCTSTQYLYYDSTCATQCPSPLVIRNDSVVAYCLLQCPVYLSWSGVCQTACPSPYRISNRNGQPTCELPCDNTAYYYFDDYQTCESTCPSPFTTVGHVGYTSCILPASGMSWLVVPPSDGVTTFITVFKGVSYIRYLNLKLPPRLQTFARSSGRPILSSKPPVSIPVTLTSQFTNHTLPAAFANRGLYSSFFLNFYDESLTIAAILSLIIVFGLFETALSVLKMEKAHACLQKISHIFRWNVLLLTIIYFFDDIILYASIEYITFDQGSSANLTFVGLTMSIIFLALGLFTLLGGFLLVRMARISRIDSVKERSSIVYIDFVKAWQGAQFFFRGVNFSGRFKRNFYPIYALRMIVPMVFTIVLVDYCVVNCIIQIIFNVAIMLYIAMTRPLKKKVNQYQILILEFLTLITNGATFAVVISAVNGNEKTDSAIKVGDMIIIMNDIMNLVVVVFLPIKVVIETVAMYKHLKVNPHKNWIEYIEIVTLVFQQGAFGFEEMIQDTYTKDLVDTGPKKGPVKVVPVVRRQAIQVKTHAKDPNAPEDKDATADPNAPSPVLLALASGAAEGTPESPESADAKVQIGEAPSYISTKAGTLANTDKNAEGAALLNGSKIHNRTVDGNPLSQSKVERNNKSDIAPLLAIKAQKVKEGEKIREMMQANSDVYFEDPRAIENVRRNISDYRKQVMLNMTK